MMDFEPVMKKAKPSAEEKVKCSLCLKEFKVPGEISEYFCIYCGKKGSKTPSSSVSKQPRKIISLDALIGKPSSKPELIESCVPTEKDNIINPTGDLVEVTSPPVEYIEQMRCIVCHTIVAPDATSCPACGVQFSGEESSIEPIMVKSKESQNICDTCGTFSPEPDTFHHCAVCGRTFCNSCPLPHIPPESKSIEAKLVYKYKLKTQTVWTSDAVKFNEPLPSPLCKNCYMSEYDKSFLRLHSRVKSWEIDMKRDADTKILERIFPERKEVVKMRKVVPATEFFEWITKS